MKCPKCQTENPEAKKFCHKCVTRLSLLCPQCGSKYLPGDEFCGEYGHQLEEHVTPEIKPFIEGRQITVLFSDLSRYTAMSERLDAEEVKNLMRRIFGLMPPGVLFHVFQSGNMLESRKTMARQRLVEISWRYRLWRATTSQQDERSSVCRDPLCPQRGEA